MLFGYFAKLFRTVIFLNNVESHLFDWFLSSKRYQIRFLKAKCLIECLTKNSNQFTLREVSKYGPYFLAFGLNTGKYGAEITPYLDTFRAVLYVPQSITLYANVFLSMSRKILKTIFFSKKPQAIILEFYT